MFWIWIGLAFLGIVLLTWIGASMTRRPPNDDFERSRRRNDGPVLPGPDDTFPHI
jgi:hypothetical protein